MCDVQGTAQGIYYILCQQNRIFDNICFLNPNYVKHTRIGNSYPIYGMSPGETVDTQIMKCNVVRGIPEDINDIYSKYMYM